MKRSSPLQLETMVMKEEHGDLSKDTNNARRKIETRSWEGLTTLLNSNGTDIKPTEKCKKDIPIGPNSAIEETDAAVNLDDSQVGESGGDLHKPSSSRPQVAVPEVQPALSDQTVAQGSRRRRVRGSSRRITRGSPRALSRWLPQRSRRSLRLIRPARSEEAAQQNCDREWRQFKIEQRRDYMDIRREQNRIRVMELQTRRGWQALALRGLDIVEKFVNNYLKDPE